MKLQAIKRENTKNCGFAQRTKTVYHEYFFKTNQLKPTIIIQRCQALRNKGSYFTLFYFNEKLIKISFKFKH